MNLQLVTTKPISPISPRTNREVMMPESSQHLEYLGLGIKAWSLIPYNKTKLLDSTPKHDVQEDMVNDIPLPEVRSMKSVDEGALTTVLQLWEGVVVSVDFKNSTMMAKLIDRSGGMADHLAEIDLQWIVDQDYDLLSAGSVFYWTLFKETKRGSIKNSQEIKFRRLPNWSKSNIKMMNDEASNLANKFSRSMRLAD